MYLQLPASQEPHNLFRILGDPRGRHSGEDYGWASGDDIFAAASGVVTYVYSGDSYNEGWGRRIAITHEGGAVTTYNHMKPGGVHVRYGQRVEARQHIGDMGDSGKAPNGRHLHFELYIDGVRVDPRPYFGDRHLPGTEPVVGEPAGQPEVGERQRVVRHAVTRRSAPRVADSTRVTKPNAKLTAGTVGNFTGFIRGEKVTLNGITTNIWYRGISGHYFWAGNFTTQDTDGLKDLGTYKAPAKPATKPKKRYVRLPAPWFHFASEKAARNAPRNHQGPTLPAGDYEIVDQARDLNGPYQVWAEIGGRRRKVWVGTGRTNPPVVKK